MLRQDFALEDRMHSHRHASVRRYTRLRAAIAIAAGVLALGIGNRPLASQEKPAARPSKVEYEGWQQYMVHCARCHGDDAVAGVVAPDLRKSVSSGAANEATFHSIVKAGRRTRGMPGFQGTLSDEQISAIYAYVAARAKGRLPAGRPGAEPAGP
jgi:mono/diheme cytochrome c family protein